MKSRYKVILLVLLFFASVALTAIYLSSRSVPVLEPKGVIAVQERELLITASLLMLIVVIPVFILTWLIAWRYRESNEKSKHSPDWEHNSVAECCWWGIPLIIVIILAIITWKTSHTLNPFRPIVTGKKPIEIQVVALEWKWLFIYPEYGIATVNFVQFPEKTPLNFEITADAPMNSFWIPQLGGQIYAMPSMRMKLHLLANEVGDYRGSSSNFSGKGFAGMTFIARASSDEEFEQWIERVRDSQNLLTFEKYNQLVEPTSYDPVATYRLEQLDLFERILEKYSPPARLK
ncbi:MAG: Cytochrome bo(3) ubiquinol oxidase subunit 2 [Chlamydiae bacterium]|nr:Cytochrome bo(3) ubiquinol oxidase subunit 2 [Chlamydiota bacterium]